MRRSRWKRSVLDLLMYRENQRCRFGAKWKEIWLRLGAFFFFLPRGPAGIMVMTTWVWNLAPLLISCVTLTNYLLSLWLSFSSVK